MGFAADYTVHLATLLLIIKKNGRNATWSNEKYFFTHLIAYSSKSQYLTKLNKSRDNITDDNQKD
ncbi:hypothetical protein BEL05_07510 [Shewanella colwelliana]|uniref:Uncharacterized protein n=1 Tax=Shewanella colwelliana TaxID=23 RepID=A0A1E5IY23_SHECO|nr:hypothetical protein BEL05_07510 [Shewanella colwelliana]